MSDSEECEVPESSGDAARAGARGGMDSGKRPRLLGQRRSDGGGQRLGRSLEQPQSQRSASHGVTVGRHRASAECHAWLETDQIARGELKVPRRSPASGVVPPGHHSGAR